MTSENLILYVASYDDAAAAAADFQSLKEAQIAGDFAVVGAVGLLHAASKSEDKAKVVRCFSLALLLLIAAWSVNASWGPDFFKSTLMFKVGATAPVAP